MSGRRAGSGDCAIQTPLNECVNALNIKCIPSWCTHLLLHIFDAAAPTTICHLDLQQRQFPVQLAFYMSIIKAQGQTLSMACSCPGPCLHAGSCMSLSCVGPWDIWCSCITAACWPPLCKGRTGHLHHNFVLSGSLIIPFLAISFCFFPLCFVLLSVYCAPTGTGTTSCAVAVHVKLQA